MNIGWIGIGRMGLQMAGRLLRAGHSVSVWNRTRSKAEPLLAEGATLVDRIDDLGAVDVLFTMVSTGKDLMEVCFGEGGVYRDGVTRRPPVLVDCSTIGMDDSAAVRARLKAIGVDYLAAPVSGNPKCVIAGKLSCVVSGPEPVFEAVKPLLLAFAPRGAAYAGDGELARMCKIAVNIMLAVVSENLMEVTLLAQKAGVPRHAFLEFVNNSVAGSIFTRYKTPALVNLDWTTTFAPAGMRKDVDLGLKIARDLDMPMPVTAATREVFQAHFGVARSKPDPEAYVQKDFAALLETLALMGGVRLESENVAVSDGLDPETTGTPAAAR
jgi:3-hydroxyisobutyrate dehydrogenase